MGTTFTLAEKFLEKIEPDSVFVEIGSDRGEGSTQYFADLAQQHNTVLHTVDLLDRKNKNNDHPSVRWHIGAGSTWAQTEYPKIGKKISLLYLDNFDWTWDPDDIPGWIQSQITEYKTKFNIDMNNANCQAEHLAQITNLLPWLSDSAVVLCDDTFPLSINATIWGGKCGLVVPYLENFNFRVVDTVNCGLIMARGIDFPKTTML